MDNNDLIEEICGSPEQYALVKNEFRKGFEIVDIKNKMFVLIEDDDLKHTIQKKLKENGGRTFSNIREAYNAGENS